uniref:Uncharacterized protein n=1 Tax=mine drainage metagenome TaxID=410659 RepID=E6QX28_9ZZZZ
MLISARGFSLYDIVAPCKKYKTYIKQFIVAYVTGKIHTVSWQKSDACDVKSHQLLSHLARGSETRCSFNGSLPVQAKLATAWSEATGTMEPFGREGKAAR